MKNIDFESIGMRVKSIRTRKKFTQDQLAEMIDSDRAVIGRIESGKTCSIDYLIKIANALEVSTDSLLIDCLDHPTMTNEEYELCQLLVGCTLEESAILIHTLSGLREILKRYTIK